MNAIDLRNFIFSFSAEGRVSSGALVALYTNLKCGQGKGDRRYKRNRKHWVDVGALCGALVRLLAVANLCVIHFVTNHLVLATNIQQSFGYYRRTPSGIRWHHVGVILVQSSDF